MDTKAAEQNALEAQSFHQASDSHRQAVRLKRFGCQWNSAASYLRHSHLSNHCQEHMLLRTRVVPGVHRYRLDQCESYMCTDSRRIVFSSFCQSIALSFLMDWSEIDATLTIPFRL